MYIRDEIQRVFHNDDRYVQSAFQDLFAIGCYFHATGKDVMGMKMCATALRGAKCRNEKTVLDYVRGNERDCFEAARPHSEFDSLLDDMP